jgi:carboxyl-terminal processing protease
VLDQQVAVNVILSMRSSLDVRCRTFAAALALLLLVGAAGTTPALAEAASVRAEVSSHTVDLAKLFDAVVQTIEQKFVDVELLKRIDWQARAAAVRPSVLSSTSPDDAVRAINALIAELKTSHTGLFTPDDHRYYITLDALNGAGGTRDLITERFWGTGPYYPGIGIFTANLDGRHFIDGILEGSPAAKAGLKFGDEVLSVDGRAYNPVTAFRGRVGATVNVDIRRTREAKPERYAVEVIPIVPSVAFTDAMKASARVIERDGRRIGYVRVWSINDARGFRAALASLDITGEDNGKAPDGLVVDLRGRVGGNIGASDRMLDLLGTAPKPYWGSFRFIDRSGADRTPQTDTTRSQVKAFAGRSVVLIDHQTRSAGEVMAHAYKRSRFGTVFGTPTAGAVTSGAPFAMPGGYVLYVAVAKLEFDGESLEGKGVAPDHRIERPLPYAAGADPVLDAAVEFLAKPAAP